MCGLVNKKMGSEQGAVNRALFFANWSMKHHGHNCMYRTECVALKDGDRYRIMVRIYEHKCIFYIRCAFGRQG